MINRNHSLNFSFQSIGKPMKPSNIEKAFEEDTILNAFVKRRTKGGLIFDIRV